MRFFSCCALSRTARAPAACGLSPGGQPIIDVFFDFDDNRAWPDIQTQCAAIRQELEARITGAKVIVLPARHLP